MAVLLAGASGLCGQAQQEPEWIGSKGITADVEFRFESDSDKRTEKQGGGTTSYSSTRFHEILNVHWSGFVYHPRFLTLTTTFGFDVEQASVVTRSPGQSSRVQHDSVLPQYSIQGVFLPEHPVTLTFALDKHRSLATAAFAQVAEVDSDSQRASLLLKSGPLPTEVFVSRLHSAQTALGFGESSDNTILSHGLHTSHVLGPSETNLNYEFTDETEDITNVGDQTTRFLSRRKSHDASLSNLLKLDPNGDNRLDSRLSYRKGLGDNAGIPFSDTRIGFDERLHLTHWKQLTSDYSVRYSEDTVGPSRVKLTGETASLTHRLFDSLTTTVEGHASQETFDGSGRDTQGGSVNLSYRKTIPHGLLLINAGAGTDFTKETGASVVLPVLDESHTLSNLTTIFLGNVGVILGDKTRPVIVRDPTKTKTYLENIDYRLLPQGGLTEIRRLPAGAIPEGGTVLVSYFYQTGGPVSFNTRMTNWRVELDLFDHLALYTGVRSTTQTLLSGQAQGRLQDLRDTLTGARLRWGPTTTTVERENYDSSLTPYTSDRASVDLNAPLGELQSLVASASTRRVVFGQGGQSTYQNLSGTYRLAYPHGPTLSVTAGIEDHNDRGFTGTYTYARIEATYRLRATEFSLSYRLNDRSDDFATERANSLIFFIKRTF